MGAIALPPGRFFFEELGEIGAGGLGRVDKIRITASNATGKDVGTCWARKRLNANWAANPIMIKRLDREIAALKMMSHPNIVTCEGENLPGGERFYVMQLFSTSVRKHIAGGGFRNDWRAVAAQGVILADAMSYAHSKGATHRDLKPDNLLFNPGGPITITDWGIGYFIHRESKVLVQLTRGGMGTEYYCSLEQWASGKCDHRGDIYSLGMTLDEWVRGSQRAIRVGQGIGGPSVAESGEGTRRFNLLLQQMTQVLANSRTSNMNAVSVGLRAALAAG